MWVDREFVDCLLLLRECRTLPSNHHQHRLQNRGVYTCTPSSLLLNVDWNLRVMSGSATACILLRKFGAAVIVWGGGAHVQLDVAAAAAVGRRSINQCSQRSVCRTLTFGNPSPSLK
jgi:hypothetical protein